MLPSAGGFGGFEADACLLTGGLVTVLKSVLLLVSTVDNEGRGDAVAMLLGASAVVVLESWGVMDLMNGIVGPKLALLWKISACRLAPGTTTAGVDMERGVGAFSFAARPLLCTKPAERRCQGSL